MGSRPMLSHCSNPLVPWQDRSASIQGIPCCLELGQTYENNYIDAKERDSRLFTIILMHENSK